MLSVDEYEDAIFYSPLDRILHNHRISNVWLGREVGCGDSEISRYRHGVRTPPLERQIKICRILDCDLSDLWPVAEGKEET